MTDNEKMPTEVKKTVAVSTLGAACIGGSATLVFPFLPLYLLELGATKENVAMWSSLIVSAMFITGAIVMPIWGALADRIGKKKMILRAAGCLSISYFVSYIVATPLQFLFARIFQGFSFGYNPVSQALLSDIAGPHAGTAIGILIGGRSVGTMLGPFLGGIFGSWAGLRNSFLIAGFVDLFAFFLVLLFIKEPRRNLVQGPKAPGLVQSFRQLSKNTRFLELMALMVVNQAALLIINPLVSLHIVELSGGVGDITLLSGIICGGAGVAGALSGPFWGHFGEKHGFRLAIFLSLLGDGIFALAQFFAPTVLLFGLCQFCFGLFSVGGTTSITSAVSEVTGAENHGSAFGINASAMNIGNFLGPVLGGTIATACSVRTVFLFSGCVQLVTAAFLLWQGMSARRKNERKAESA